jgi:hypothetical protein
LTVILSAVSAIAEIEAGLPKLTAGELVRGEQAVHSQFRQRGGGIIYTVKMKAA